MDRGKIEERVSTTSVMCLSTCEELARNWHSSLRGWKRDVRVCRRDDIYLLWCPSSSLRQTFFCIHHPMSYNIEVPSEQRRSSQSKELERCAEATD